MLVNSSSISNDYLAYRCITSKVSLFMSTGTTIIKMLLLLSVSSFVLYLAHQRWRQHRSFKTVSHSDLFTFHLAAMELTWVFGCFLFLAGVYTNNSDLLTTSKYICYVPFYGELFFHLLTCVERYLAVVHPVTYLSLRNAQGVRIRNISIGCTWLLSVGITIMIKNAEPHYSAILIFCFFVFSIPVILFCSISVLWVLICQGPKDRGKEKNGVVQSKRRALYTITVISSVVWLWFVGVLVGMALSESPSVSTDVECLVKASLALFDLPSSLVLSLLYLHKTRKLLCCRAQ